MAISCVKVITLRRILRAFVAGNNRCAIVPIDGSSPIHHIEVVGQKEIFIQMCEELRHFLRV